MSFKLEDIPQEVQMVWMLEYSGMPVGSEMYNRCKAIAEQYPQYFDEAHAQRVRDYREQQRKIRQRQDERTQEIFDQLCKIFESHSIWKKES